VSVIIKGKNPVKPHTVRYWVDGKQREKSFATAREARDFKIKTDHDVRAQIFVDEKDGQQKFSDAAAAWLAAQAIAEQTLRGYQSILSVWVLPVLGDKSLTAAAKDRDAVVKLLTQTMRHLGYSRRKVARQIIVSVMDEAVRAGKLAKHSLGEIELANDGKASGHDDFVFPTFAQVAQLAGGMGEHALLIWLMRGCGLRIQEAIAVRKEGFRLNGKSGTTRLLRVTEQAFRDGTRTMPMKHRRKGDYRDVPVPAYLWEMVKDLPEGYLFGTDGAGFPHYNTIHARFMRHAAKAGIPATFTPHSLRHAFASAHLGQGVPITNLAKWLGHKDINVTYSIYGHLLPDADEQGTTALDAEYSAWVSAA